MTSTEVLATVREYEVITGRSSEDWDGLIAWIALTKGQATADAFALRCMEAPL